MTRAFAIVAAGLASLGACASAPGIDRPVPLEAGYALREIGAGKPSDRCGPEFISDNLPKPVVSALGPLIDGSFRSVCARHDACYELREQTQAWCDERMLTEMLDICDAGRSGGSIGGGLCRIRARLYAGLVDNSFGAYSYHGPAGGEIVAVTSAPAAPGELKLCVTAANTTPLLQEYILELRAANGRRIDREPDMGERNVRAGQSAEICTGTGGSPFWSARRLDGPVTVRLLADEPDSLAFVGDRTVVDQRSVDIAGPDPR